MVDHVSKRVLTMNARRPLGIDLDGVDVGVHVIGLYLIGHGDQRLAQAEGGRSGGPTWSWHVRSGHRRRAAVKLEWLVHRIEPSPLGAAWL